MYSKGSIILENKGIHLQKCSKAYDYKNLERIF